MDARKGHVRFAFSRRSSFCFFRFLYFIPRGKSVNLSVGLLDVDIQRCTLGSVLFLLRIYIYINFICFLERIEGTT